MNWMSGRSYYVAYRSIDQFDSIIFFYNYFLTWSAAILCSLILPILFLFAPSSLQSKRTSHFFLICFICVSNMSCLYIQPYMFTGLGEPNLSFDLCRFLVYISAFAKPMGLYLTLVFSIERMITKIFRWKTFRLLMKRIYLLFIIVIITIILSIRLWEILKYIQRNSSKDFEKNPTDRALNFQYCYRSIEKENYAKILSFYVIQNPLEYIVLALIALLGIVLFISQFCLPNVQRRSLSRWSVNTKFYFSLTFCLIAFELILLVLHQIVGNEDNENSETQVNYLQIMILIYNIRCIVLPLLICFTCCQPWKQGIYELIIRRNYREKLNDDDERTNQININ